MCAVLKRWLLVIAFLALGAILNAQGSLSEQVLQLLVRNNTWVGTQTFQDLRMSPATIPATTTNRIYADLVGNLYYNGGLIAGAGGGVTPHNLLSSTHPDTLAASPPTRGDLIAGNATPLWARLAIGASGAVLRSNGTDPAWSTDGTGLTTLNASSLSTGTVALARLPTTIGNAQIDAAAAIAWTKISKTGSSLADLTTRSATDLTSGSLADARLSANVSLFGTSVDTNEISSGAVTASKLADFLCTAGQAMTWQVSGWGCGTFGTGSGSVTSVAMTVPSILAIAGTPITTSGTLALTLATQTANTVFAGPTSAGPSAPTFRALVNADLPTSGVAAGTYVKVTLNTRGIATAASATFDAATDAGATILPFLNGGTGIAAAADDTTIVSSGTAWVARTLANCTTTPLGYTQATNLFSCLTTLSGMTAITSTTLTGTTVNATTLVTGPSGASVTGIFTGTATYDPGAIADQASVTTTLTVTGVTTGAATTCEAVHSAIDSENLLISAFPSGADTVRVVIGNISGGPLSPGSGTLRATCTKI